MLYSLLFLVACGSSSNFGAEMSTRLSDARAQVAAHREAVNAATTMDEVTQLESDNADAMSGMMGDMDGTMQAMMGCHMSGMMSDSMGDADMQMSSMMDAIDEHAAAHADHADMQACMDAETAFSDDMSARLDAMGTDMMGFDDAASCPSSGGMM